MSAADWFATTRELIARHEGLRLKPYVDSVGKTTIGYGYNLTDRGIPQRTADAWLDADIASTVAELTRTFPWFSTLDDMRKVVITDMAFNLGVPRLSQFVQTLAAVACGDYLAAADGMLASKWARQVGARAHELAEMMRTGRPVSGNEA